MNLFPGRSAQRRQEFVDLARLQSEDQHRRELGYQAAARKVAEERETEERKLQEQADEILDMSPDRHRQRAAYLMAVADTASWDRKPYFLLKANAHLGLAQTDRRSS